MPSTSCRRRRRRRHGHGRKVDDDLPPPPAPVVEYSPWASLPRDVLWTVISLLPQADVLRGAGLACASWRRVAVDEPLLWRHVDLANDDDDALWVPRVTGWKAMARAAVDRSAGLCQSFRGRADADLLLYLAQRAPSLRRLHVTSWLEMPDGAMTTVIRKLPLLKEVVVARGNVRNFLLLGRDLRRFQFQPLDTRGSGHNIYDDDMHRTVWRMLDK